MSRSAAPGGMERPCSQSRMVATGVRISSANACCDKPSLMRAERTAVHAVGSLWVKQHEGAGRRWMLPLSPTNSSPIATGAVHRATPKNRAPGLNSSCRSRG
jgi:hypothetical protein